ncbi:CPBP family intramembrane metalloprotease, partial [Mycobacterium tuberculosis]|nr:CPBP family intramembrane metalloprotease [Mycobacterium tuberculosis]
VSAGGTAIAWSGGWVRPAEPATLPSGIVLAVVAVLYLVTYIAQGAGEEVVARGLLLRGTSWWIGLGPAVVLQALFFLAIHVGNPGFTPLYG